MNSVINILITFLLVFQTMMTSAVLQFDKYLKLDPKKEHSPQNLKVAITDMALNMQWNHPSPRTVSLRGYRITIGNFTDDISSDESTYRYHIDRSGNIFLTCSLYNIEVAAVYRDSTYAPVSVKMKHKPAEVSSLECVAEENTTSIEVRWKSKKVPGECATATLLVSAYGSQLLNENVKEKIPEFEVAAYNKFLLEGLFPNAEYILHVKNRLTFGYSSPFECTVKTRELAPLWVTDEKAVCTSRTSISVSWTPPEDSNGKILRYWIKVTDSKYFSVSYYEVEGHYTRANIQHLDQEVEYTFVIWPENGAGNGTLSNNLSVYCF